MVINLDRVRAWVGMAPRRPLIDRMERAAASTATDSKAVADRLDSISRNRDPLAELVRNVKSAQFRRAH